MIRFRIIDAADQQFSTVMNNRRVTIRLRYNYASTRWSFDLSIDDLPVLHGRRIVTDTDLLAAFDFGIGVMFASSTTAGAEPGRYELPAGEVSLFHVMPDEIDAAIANVSAG